MPELYRPKPRDSSGWFCLLSTADYSVFSLLSAFIFPSSPKHLVELEQSHPALAGLGATAGQTSRLITVVNKQTFEFETASRYALKVHRRHGVAGQDEQWLYGHRANSQMEFKYGDRVRMLKHADWKNEAVGTIVSFRTSRATLHDGSADALYWIEFDELQRDYTDELNGKDLTYKQSTVLGRFLRPLGEAPYNPPMQWTGAAGKVLVVRESACCLGH